MRTNRIMKLAPMLLLALLMLQLSNAAYASLPALRTAPVDKASIDAQMYGSPEGSILIPVRRRTPTPTQQTTPPSTNTPAPTNTPIDTPTNTPVPTSSPTPVPPTATPAGGFRYGLIGQGGLGESIDTGLLQAQHAAGVRVRLLHLGWDVLQPTGPGSWSSGTTAAFQQRIDAFVAQGTDVQLVLDLGLHYLPTWVDQVDPLVDQYGNVLQARSAGGGVNVYWSPVVRQHVANYISLVFSNLDFRGRLWAVRVGPYQGELLYPHQANPGGNVSFWAFDADAQAQSPVPGWRPGDPSPNDEARRFYYWYVDNLVETFNFFLSEIRRYTTAYVAPVTPGSGMWDGTANRLIGLNLYDTSQSFYGTGNYWQRVFNRLPAGNLGVLNWCSSLGDGSGRDDSPNWWDWSSGKLMAYLTHQNGRQIYGENPGRNAFDTSGGADPRTTMQWIFSTMQSSGYLGLMWVRQADMVNPAYASLAQYKDMISQYR